MQCFLYMKKLKVGIGIPVVVCVYLTEYPAIERLNYQNGPDHDWDSFEYYIEKSTIFY